jgi:MFS family permease
LSLFRNRGYAITILATFLAAIGFFGAIIFLPRWFQFVKGVSPTDSGLQSLALLAGLILSSIVSGALISRTGRYKVLIVVSLAIMSVGLFLLTNLTAATDLPMLWVWMFITGLGIGPTLSGFTIIVQSVVPFERLGVATGNLVFFRQIGGSVGLAIVGTLFGSAFASQLPVQLEKDGVPAQIATQIAARASSGGQLTAVGTDLATSLRQALPPEMQALVPQIVNGIHEAFSLAVASTFWFGLGATLLALVAVAVALPEVPLRGLARKERPERAVSAPAAG